MADQKISERNMQVLISPGTPGYLKEVTVGDADEKPGMAVTGVGETHPEVDLRAKTESLYGILLNRSDLDIDTAIPAADGANGVPCARFRMGAVVLGFIQATSETIVAGAPLEGGSEAGKFVDYISADNAGDTYNTVASNAEHDRIGDGIATIMEDYTQDNTNDLVREILL